MSEADALLAAIRQAPDDDAPRLIYAAWLDEHGQPERAEFIRVQIELARQNSPTLRKREAELLAEHHDALVGQLAAPHFRFRFHRGLIVGFGHSGVFQSVQKRLQWSSMLRFSAHGLVMRSINTTGLLKTSECFESSAAYLQTGKYVLDPFDIPPRIRLNFGIRSLVEMGVLNGSSLTISRSGRGSHSKQLTKYIHVHINGYDSFSES